MAATDWSALAISSMAATYATAPTPAPPYASGTSSPMSPSSAIRRKISAGNRPVRFHSSRRGRISFRANSRQRAWRDFCSSVRSKFTPAPHSPA
jgi:hypothetical protein